jgi:RNA polymerase sigma-70 factor, ECF subfamily
MSTKSVPARTFSAELARAFSDRMGEATTLIPSRMLRAHDFGPDSRPQEITVAAEPGVEAAEAAPATPHGRRLRQLLDQHFREVWRVLRRLGVPSSTVDDAAQQVFIVAAQKLSQVRPGSERAFLVSTAVRVAANARRAASAREVADASAADQIDPTPSAEALLDEKRLRILLDRVLDALPDELRSVFVLFELEGLSASQIAELLEIPPGTVASRLRRAREQFHAAAKRTRAQIAFRGGG